MLAHRPKHRVGTSLASVVLLVGLVVGSSATQTSAQPPQSEAGRLEAAFWQCDYDATVHGLERVDVNTCTDVYDAIKRTRFAGDFEALLEWWQRHRTHEHAKLRATRVASRERR